VLAALEGDVAVAALVADAKPAGKAPPGSGLI
jgi:hypothetical protein